MDSLPLLLSDIEWEVLYKRLVVFALKLTSQMSSVFDGVSSEDLVGETLVAYFAQTSGMKWNPTQGTLERFLCGVLKNKFLIHVRRNKQVGGSLDDVSFAPFSQRPSQNGAPNSAKISDLIKIAAEGDYQLQNLLKAADDLDGPSKVNQQLSQRLNVSIPDVVNMRKRLTRRFEHVSRVQSTSGSTTESQPEVAEVAHES